MTKAPESLPFGLDYITSGTPEMRATQLLSLIMFVAISVATAMEWTPRIQELLATAASSSKHHSH